MSAVNAIAFPVPPRTWSASVLRRRPDLVILHTASGETTAAVHIRNKRRLGTRPVTLLYSHANAEDLGLSLPFLDILSRYCGCDVLAYEYLGYSISSGDPCEAGCVECIDAALAYLIDECLVPPQRVVAFGRSIGSGPTVDLAARRADLGGMILQSPIASAGLVVFPPTLCKALSGYDLFRNYDKISRVKCRTLIIHGRDDKMVPFEHAMMLFPLVADKHPPLWIDGAGHHDMPDDLCLNAVANFVNFVEERAHRVLREAERRRHRGLSLSSSRGRYSSSASSSWSSASSSTRSSLYGGGGMSAFGLLYAFGGGGGDERDRVAAPASAAAHDGANAGRRPASERHAARGDTDDGDRDRDRDRPAAPQEEVSWFFGLFGSSGESSAAAPPRPAPAQGPSAVPAARSSSLRM